MRYKITTETIVEALNDGTYNVLDTKTEIAPVEQQQVVITTTFTVNPTMKDYGIITLGSKKDLGLLPGQNVTVYADWCGNLPRKMHASRKNRIDGLKSLTNGLSVGDPVRAKIYHNSNEVRIEFCVL